MRNFEARKPFFLSRVFWGRGSIFVIDHNPKEGAFRLAKGVDVKLCPFFLLEGVGLILTERELPIIGVYRIFEGAAEGEVALPAKTKDYGV